MRVRVFFSSVARVIISSPEDRNYRLETRWGALDDAQVRQRSAKELLGCGLASFTEMSHHPLHCRMVSALHLQCFDRGPDRSRCVAALISARLVVSPERMSARREVFLGRDSYAGSEQIE